MPIEVKFVHYWDRLLFFFNIILVRLQFLFNIIAFMILHLYINLVTLIQAPSPQKSHWIINSEMR